MVVEVLEAWLNNPEQLLGLLYSAYVLLSDLPVDPKGVVGDDGP